MEAPATELLDMRLGAPCWMDLMSSDPQDSVRFYTELFGWTANDTPPQFGGYTYFEKDGKAVGGCMRNEAEWNAPDGWSIFLKSEDVRATAAVAEGHGGEVLVPPMDVEDNGSFTILRDAGGAMVGAWQAGTETGFGVLREDGAPVWFELHTREYDKTVQFYRDVFGWKPHVMADTPDFRYTTYTEGMDGKAGIMDASAMLAEGTSAHWSVYIGAKDVDLVLDKAVRLGGSVQMPAENTPYGRLAVAADSTGAVFKLHGQTP